MGLALALLEVITGDRVNVDFAHPNLNRDIAFNRDQILKALGVDVPAAQTSSTWLWASKKPPGKGRGNRSNSPGD
jgi:hypothetical protein